METNQPRTPSVSVVIPTYNGRALLERHLPAVLNCLRGGDEIIIVDDASTDTTTHWLQTTFSLTETTSTEWQGHVTVKKNTIDLVVLKNTKNVRFALSCNRGFKKARHPFIFLLNNDVSPEPDVLTHLLPHFSDPAVFGVGCCEKAIHVGGRASGKNRIWFERGWFLHSSAGDLKPGPTAWVSGGSGIFDRKKLLKLGGFDPDFAPAYWEDIDLSWRAHTQGWQTYFEPDAVVQHHHETTNQTAFGQRHIHVMSLKNSLVFLWKHASLWQKLQHIFWLPYHTLITNAKMDGAVVAAWRWWWKESRTRKKYVS